jgi:hypothetical protein
MRTPLAAFLGTIAAALCFATFTTSCATTDAPDDAKPNAHKAHQYSPLNDMISRRQRRSRH